MSSTDTRDLVYAKHKASGYFETQKGLIWLICYANGDISPKRIHEIYMEMRPNAVGVERSTIAARCGNMVKEGSLFISSKGKEVDTGNEVNFYDVTERMPENYASTKTVTRPEKIKNLTHALGLALDLIEGRTTPDQKDNVILVVKNLISISSV